MCEGCAVEVNASGIHRAVTQGLRPRATTDLALTGPVLGFSGLQTSPQCSGSGSGGVLPLAMTADQGR